MKFILSLLICLTFGSSNLYAQQIDIAHVPAKADDLPFPGTPMELAATVVNTKDSQLKMSAFVIRDGKIMDLNVNTLSTNNNEQIVYSTTINAPLAELNYQFILSDDKGIITSSRRFTIRRSCIPNITDLDTDAEAPTDTKERLKFLKKQAGNLQNEVQNYETALALLDELRSLTDN